MQKCIIQFDMIQSFKMVFDTSRISTQKIREIIEELKNWEYMILKQAWFRMTMMIKF